MATLNPQVGAPNARILGIGAYRPSRIIPNAEVVEAIAQAITVVPGVVLLDRSSDASRVRAEARSLKPVRCPRLRAASIICAEV